MQFSADLAVLTFHETIFHNKSDQNRFFFDLLKELKNKSTEGTLAADTKSQVDFCQLLSMKILQLLGSHLWQSLGNRLIFSSKILGSSISSEFNYRKKFNYEFLHLRN